MRKLRIIASSLLAACASGAFADTDMEDAGTAIDPTQALQQPAAALAAVNAPTAAEKTARSYQTWLTQINTPYAYQLGAYTGKGVVVGVVDSGVDANNPSLKGQVVLGYNALTNKTGLGANIADQIGHGSHVSGIIAGTLAYGGLLEGVAPGAQLAMAKVFGATGSTSSTTIDAGINWLVNTAKTPIISMSLGGASPANLASLQNGVVKGALFTIATGNDGAKNPSWPAGSASAAWAKGQIIAVGAVDSNNKLATFSNWCGSVAANCVVAPGVNIASTYMAAANGAPQYAYMSGTSMATPMVAGEAALIKSQWNFLTAGTIAQVIFKSATHLCSNGKTGAACTALSATPDVQYGWGLINAAAAMQPIGGLTAPTVKGTTTNLTGTALVAGSTGVSSGLKSLTSMGVDTFGRGFAMNIGVASASSASRPSLPVDLFSSFDRQSSLVESSRNGEHLALAYSTPSSLAAQDPLAAAPAMAHMSWSRKSADGSTTAFGMGGMSKRFFGLEATGQTPLSLNQDSGRFNAPYFGLVKDATHVGYSMAMDSSTTLRLGSMSKAPVLTLQPGMPTVGYDTARRSLTALEVQKDFSSASMVATVGVLRESNSVLGTTGTGALGLQASPATSFVSFAGVQRLDENYAIAGMVSYGRTAGYTNQSTDASFINGSSAMGTVSWSLGLARRNWVNKGDSVGLSIAMPTKAVSGAMAATTGVAQSQTDGSLLYSTQAYSLRPAATEHDFELAYATPVGKLAKLSAAVMVRVNPGHDSAMPTDKVAGVRYTTRF
jgi:subtilisin family serine protease